MMSDVYRDTEAFSRAMDASLVARACAEELNAALAGYADNVRQKIEEIVTRIEAGASRQAPSVTFSVDRARAMSFFVEHLQGERQYQEPLSK